MNISPSTEMFLHTQKLKGQMRDLIDHLRADLDVDMEPRVRSLLETSAVVLTGLVKDFDDYENQEEGAWSDPWGSKPSSCQDSEL
jgi:hypothetical protein